MEKKLYYRVKQSTQKKRKPFMEVEVTLIERKPNYFGGHCLIAPVSGSGEIWVRERTLVVR